MILEEFNDYAGIRVLEYFLENPTTEVYIRGLSKVLKISPATSKKFCDLFFKKEIVEKKRVGNVILFMLKNNDYVKQLKKTYFVFDLKNCWEDKINQLVSSVALYGSYASGEYDEESDVDLLIISKKKLNRDLILSIQSKLKKEINISEFDYINWQKEKKTKTAFSKEVLDNHFLIYGVDL